jgi:hypothetical protein
MADRPIIFSAPMVLALLAGRKSMTRRLIKPMASGALRPGDMVVRWGADFGGQCACFRPRFAPGDRLWVREQWSGARCWRNTKPADRVTGCYGGEVYVREDLWYWADGNPAAGDYEPPRPSIHMPRWASRLTLTVTDVRVQRLNDISEADAVAEGVNPCLEGHQCPNGGYGGCCATYDPVDAYATLWNSLHGPDAWAANPWVCALTFTVARGNIDEVGAP